MFGNKDKKRFKEIYKESIGMYKIVVDMETGVNYILCTKGDGISLTPLIDQNGNIKIFDEYELRELQ
ncbi:MAG: DUF6440 family protein [Tissierellia bacterium]|nr:DUF6440 family protein [Tissierellia bacterium]